MVIDQERCIGCEACSVACRLENNAVNFWIRVETQGGTEKDTPIGVFPDLSLNFLPKLCNHCLNPPCVDACPVDALLKRDDGPVVLDKNLCTLCKACENACPYQVIYINEEENIAEKCNLCIHRIDKGFDPFCVICCEGQALHFGDLNDLSSKVSQLISTREVFQLKAEEGTNPSVFYCSPKERRGL
jgi:Fe-S-cluster-containing dehydrogenase component